MRRSLKTTVTGVVILAVPAGLGAAQRRARTVHTTATRQPAITRGGLCRTITAAEALEPEEIG